MTIYNQPLNPDDIRVKAYAPVAGCWVTGNVIGWGKDFRIAGIDRKTGVVNTYEFIKETMTNWTGHKDRNGRQMFTGDVINIDYIPDKMYIYSCTGGVALIAPIGYTSEGVNFEDVEKITVDLSKGDITSHMEITGNVIQNLLPHLLEEYAKRKDIPEEDDYEDDSFWLDEDSVEIEFVDDLLDEDDCIDDFDMESDLFPIEDIDVNPGKYRALSSDSTVWVFGSPVYKFDENTKETTCNFIEFTDETNIKVTPVLPETVGKISDISDKNGDLLCEGDIVVLDGCSASVFKYLKSDNEFGVIPYNIYNTEYSDDLTNWNIIMPDVWKSNPQNIEIVGNVYTGFKDEFLENISEHIENIAGLEPNGFKIEYDENSKKKEIIYDIADKIDSVIHNIRPDLTGWYTYDFNSNNDECVIFGRWKLKGGYETRICLNTKTHENTVSFGKFNFKRNEWKNHGIISYSYNSFPSMIDSLVNIMITTDDYSSILEQAIKICPNCNVKDYKMKKGLSYDNLLKEKFDDRETVSQLEWYLTLPDCFSKKNFEKIVHRAYDKTSIWIHGLYKEIEDKSYIHTVFTDDNPLRSAGEVNEEYLSSSFCENTFLIDKDGKFIYSSDIVEYEGLGKLILYNSAEIDPNDPTNNINNDDGLRYLYWMPYEELKNVIKDAKNNKLRWRLVNYVNWLRDRNKITVVGNMMDLFVENKDVVINSNDFDHDDDPMQLVYEENLICHVSEKDNKNYWEKAYINEFKNSKNIEKFLNMLGVFSSKISELDVDDYPVVYRTMEVSNETPVTQMNIDASEDFGITVYIQNNSKASIVIMSDKIENGNMCMYAKDKPFEYICEIVGDLLDEPENYLDILEKKQYTVLLDEDKDICVTEIPHIAFFDKLSNDQEYTNQLTTQKDFIKELKSVMKPSEIDAVMCRALNEYGEVMLGRPDYMNSTLFVDSLSKTKQHYIKETLSFNTWCVDCNNRYIFDNDNILFGSTDNETIFTVNRKRRLTLSDQEAWLNEQCSWKRFCKILSEEDDIVRCVSSVLVDKLIEESIEELQWVPCDSHWMWRNQYRLMVLSNIYDDVPC